MMFSYSSTVLYDTPSVPNYGHFGISRCIVFAMHPDIYNMSRYITNIMHLEIPK
jgi:hypothetical protein